MSLARPAIAASDYLVSMEIDAIFFLRSTEGKTIAIHIEMKRDNEPLFYTGKLRPIDPEPRVTGTSAACEKPFLSTITSSAVIFCGIGTDIPFVERHFDRVVTHESARNAFPEYPHHK